MDALLLQQQLANWAGSVQDVIAQPQAAELPQEHVLLGLSSEC